MNEIYTARSLRRFASRSVCLLSPTLLASQALAEGAAARAVVDKTGAAVVAVLKDKSLDSGAKRTQIEDIVSQNFDFNTLSRLVLSRHWKGLSPAQQQEFVKEFRTHLSVTYGKNIDTYNDEKLVIVGDREEARGDWTVKSIIDRKAAEDVKVDYRLRQIEGRWMMIDVVVEGVSLISNFRAQFQDIIAKQGTDKLIALLRDKNAKGEPLKPETKKN